MVKANALFRAPARPRDTALTLRASIKRRRNLNFGSVSVQVGEQEIAIVANCIAVI